MDRKLIKVGFGESVTNKIDSANMGIEIEKWSLSLVMVFCRMRDNLELS